MRWVIDLAYLMVILLLGYGHVAAIIGAVVFVVVVVAVVVGMTRLWLRLQ